MLVLLGAGCGGDGTPAPPTGLPAAGGGGELAYAVPALPRNLDPLAASDPATELIVRQVYEPLVGSLIGPYGGSKRQPALALSSRSSSDRRVWTLALRPGVRFQDGTPFNASAVVANSRRWRSSPAGRDLLPELFAVDAPRPDEARFVLDSPVDDLPKRLSTPQLGIVSPQALEPRSGEGARFLVSTVGSGSGPFELGQSGPNELDLARNAGWWGSDLGLGPALDSLTFTAAGSDAARLRLLRSGQAQVAEPLGPAALRSITNDPLLASIKSSKGGIGFEASVRGLAAPVQPLSGVWLTTVTG